MHRLVNQLAIKPLEREGIPGAFFQRIQSMAIYPVPVFVKAGSMAKPWLCEQRLLWLCQKVYSI